MPAGPFALNGRKEVPVLELKNRRDMDPENQWDLTDIFPNQESWEKAYAEAEAGISAISSLRGTLMKSPVKLKEGLDRIYWLNEKIERVYIYAMLQKNGDNGDPDYQAMESRAVSLYAKYSSAVSFVEPEILQIDEKRLAEYRDMPELKNYRHMLDNLNRQRAHTLDARGEQMLAGLAEAAQTPDNVFTMLESVDMTFPPIRGEDGTETALTHGNYNVFLRSPDRDVRRSAYETYFGEFRRYLNTFAAAYSGSVHFDCYFARERGYAGACEAALSASNVPVSVYDTLTESVHAGLGTMRRYLDLRKQVLGLEELHMYDLYCPLVEDVRYRLSLEECEDLVRSATAPLGPVYREHLEHAFRDRWMDIYENKGKTTGAFSCGVYGVHPYVLLNFQGELEDAFTMVHELGHSMHSAFSSEAQTYANHDYRILVAEVASTVNEVLLTKYLLSEEKDPSRRAYLLNHFLEGFRTTVFRQTLFAEFERKTHEMAEKGEPLTAQTMNRVYRDLNLLYYDGCTVDELQDIEWARIPHFYNAFYVYQYATGFSSAVAIADRILKTGDPEPYLAFLRTGGSDYPLEELKLAGVDLTEPDTVRNAMQVFSETLDAFADTISQLGK